MPTRTAAPARRPAADVAVDTRLEEQLLITSLKKLVKQEQSRTEALRQYAEAMVALRVKLGDLPGRSTAYREAVGRVYDKAGMSEGDVPAGPNRAALGAAIRYHIANVLREQGLAAEAGIALESPSERLAGARAALAAKREAGGFLADVFAPTLKWMHAIEEPDDVNEDALALIAELESEIRRLKRLAKQR